MDKVTFIKVLLVFSELKLLAAKRVADEVWDHYGRDRIDYSISTISEDDVTNALKMGKHIVELQA